MKINKNPISFPVGIDNMAGYKAYVLVIPMHYVKKAPMLPKASDITTDAEAITAKGTFEFREAGFAPKFIQCTDKTVSYKADNQGETEGQSFKQSGEFFRAGSVQDAAALARMVNNTPCYVVIEDMDGEQLLIGQPFLPVSIKPAFEGGMNREDRRGFRFTYEADSVAPAIYLESKIDVQALIDDTPAPTPTP